MIVSKEDIHAIVVDGDAEKLVKTAKVLGEKLKRDKLSTTQIRGIFGTVRQIEMRWREASLSGDGGDSAKLCWRELMLLQPKLAYQAKRHPGLTELRDMLSHAIPLVDQDRGKFLNLVDYLEATLAYHVAAGGSTR